MTAEKVLAIARGELGVKESPANSNRVKYNTWYYGREVSGAAYPWCMAFVQWVFAQAGVKLPVKTASCGALMNAAKKAGQWVTKDYRPGDVVIYDFPGGAATDHTGIPVAPTNTPVVITVGDGPAQYPFTDSCCAQATVCDIKTREKYPVRVVTNSVGGAFRWLGRFCRDGRDDLPALDGTAPAAPPAPTT